MSCQQKQYLATPTVTRKVNFSFAHILQALERIKTHSCYIRNWDKLKYYTQSVHSNQSHFHLRFV